MIVDLPSYGVEHLPHDEQKKSAVLTYKPKAAFHWPPDCLWPFMDHGPENKRDLTDIFVRPVSPQSE
jgi:hypothetical protein